MRAAVYFLTFLFGVSTAAIAKQNASPVYVPSASVVSSVNAKSSLPAALAQAYQPPSNNNAAPAAPAQEREGQAFRQEEAGSQLAPNTSPTQNYVVYYYTNPNAKTNAGYQAQPVASQQGYSPNSYLSRFDWHDAGSIFGVLALIGGGSYLVSTQFGNVKSRALRELKDMKAEDAARMAKSVMKALERVYDLTSSKQ